VARHISLCCARTMNVIIEEKKAKKVNNFWKIQLGNPNAPEKCYHCSPQCSKCPTSIPNVPVFHTYAYSSNPERLKCHSAYFLFVFSNLISLRNMHFSSLSQIFPNNSIKFCTFNLSVPSNQYG
jgi:hypothetical protein